MTDPNRERLVRAVKALAALDVRRVFLGGATVGLHIREDLLGALSRATKDVDCIVPIESQFDWAEFENKLRTAHFKNDPERKTIIRFEFDGELYDFLPYGQKMSGLLGFDITFHREAFENATEMEIAPGHSALVAPLEYLLATKVTAYRDRGADDPYTSKDLEDLVTLLIGSPWKAALSGAPAPVREAVGTWARELLARCRHKDVIDAHIPGGPNRAAFMKLVVTALEEIASYAT